jgi:hypothetical protein
MTALPRILVNISFRLGDGTFALVLRHVVSMSLLLSHARYWKQHGHQPLRVTLSGVDVIYLYTQILTKRPKHGSKTISNMPSKAKIASLDHCDSDAFDTEGSFGGEIGGSMDRQVSTPFSLLRHILCYTSTYYSSTARRW